MSICMRSYNGDHTPNMNSTFGSQSLCSSDKTIYAKAGKNICCDVIFGGKRQSAGECCCADELQIPTEPPPRICVEKLHWNPPEERKSECTLRSGEFTRDKSLKFRCGGTFKGCIEVEDKKVIHRLCLGNPVGVSFGSFALNYLKPSDEHKVLQGYATCLVAFGEIFITPEHEWTIIIINKILDEGKQLIENSLISNSELTESNVTKRFVLCKNTMETEIFEPCFMGKVISDDIAIPNLKDSLEKFFTKEKFCVLWIGEYYFLIWKTMGLYFCFDCYGRDPKNLCMDLQTGFATLLCLRKIRNIYHLIANLSNVYPEQMFTIRRIQMIKLLPCCEMAEQIDDHERKIEYEVVNDRYARLYGRLHLGSECFREFRFKQSLAVAVIAIIYSKIDATCTWDGYIIDQVLLLGTEYYKSWTFCDHCFDLGIQDIPGKFKIGQFTVEIIVNPIEESGQWQCIPNYRHSALTKAIKRGFQSSSNLLLQIERKTYALWLRNNFFYLFDPYEHQSYIGAERTKTSALHMCSTINVLCCKLTQVILEIPSSRPFYIHCLKICSIIKTSDIKCIDKNEIESSCITKRPIALNEEVASLNESIIDLRCKKEFYCLLDKGEIQEIPVADLDSPGISETQIIPTYWNVKCKVMGNLDEMPFAKEVEEESELSEIGSGTSMKIEEGEGEGEDGEEGDGEDDDDDSDAGKKKKGKGRNKSGGKRDSSADRKKGGRESDDSDGKGGGKSARTKKGNKKGGRDSGDSDGRGAAGGKKGGKGGDSDGGAGKAGTRASKTKGGKGGKRGSSSDGGVGGKKKGGKKGGNRASDSEGDGGKAGKKGGKGGKDGKRGSSSDGGGGKKGGKGGRKGSDSDGGKVGKKASKQRGSADSKKSKEGEISEAAKARKTGEVYLESAKCQPNSYPGYCPVPRNIAVIGSQSGSYESICNLLKTGFKCADRVLLMTPWGNYVVFKSKESYFLFDGCTCNVQRFRHLDLTVGTAGLLCFEDIHELVNHILTGKDIEKPPAKDLKNIIDDICNEYCK